MWSSNNHIGQLFKAMQLLHIYESQDTKKKLFDISSYSASHDKWCIVGGDGECRVGKVRASTTSPMPDHKGFKLQ